MYSKIQKNGSSTVTLSKQKYKEGFKNKPRWMNKTPQEVEAEKQKRVSKILEEFRNLRPEDLKNLVVNQYVEKLGAPCESWSLINRLLVAAAGTTDARTYRAWLSVGRKVRQGEKAFYVIAPVLKTITELKDEAKKKKNPKPEDFNIFKVVIGYRLQPEFRIEQTDGEPVKYPNEPKKVDLPFKDIVKKLKLSVSWAAAAGNYLGYYQSKGKKIVLSVYNKNVFFHELAHAIHDYIVKGNMKGGQDTDQETIAEFVSVVLADIMGIDTKGWSLKYIMHYAGDNQDKAIMNIEKNMHLIERILNYVLGIEKIQEKLD